MSDMKGITVKLSDETLRRLREEARGSGRTVAAVLRERIEASWGGAESVYARTSDLAGCLEGSRRSATNARKRFHRS